MVGRKTSIQTILLSQKDKMRQRMLLTTSSVPFNSCYKYIDASSGSRVRGESLCRAVKADDS